MAGMALGLALAMRTTLRFPVFDQDPWLLSSIPNPLVVAALVALGAALGFLAHRAGKTSWITPFLPAGLAGAVFVPSLFSVAPFTALFSGRLLDFLLVSATLLSLWRALAPRGLSRHIATSRRIAFLGFCVHLAVGVKISHDVGLSGDEPHYLLITHSLVHDGDLRVQNNYFQEDYRNFYLGKIGPHLAANTPYSIHGIGLPILLVPGYALAGLAGSLVTLALLGAMLWRGIYLAAFLLTGNREASVLAACVFGLTSPALFLSVSVYPELPAAVIVTLVAVRLLRSVEKTPLVTLGWALLIATLPFFHMKFIPLAGVLWGALAYRSERSRASVLSAAAMGALALALFYFATTGSFDPTASYGRQRIFLSAIPIGLLGLFFDQEFGLLPVSPVYLIGLAGLVPLLRRHFFFGVVSLLVLAVVALPGAAHPLWSGGNSPAARFLFPALPLLALAASRLWARERFEGVTPWLPPLLTFSLSVSLFTVFLPGQPLYLNAKDGTGRLWEALSNSWDLTSYLPSLITADASSIVLASIALTLALLALVLQFLSRPVPLPAFVLLLLAAAWAQDLTGASPSRRLEGRWVTELMRQLSEGKADAFRAFPSGERLSGDEVKARVSLRLRPFRPDGDPLHWWSLPYHIPAGRYRVSGVALEGFAPCSDRSCFEADGTHFESKVALGRFRVRLRSFKDGGPPRVHWDELFEPRPVANRTLVFAGDQRLHSFDDGAYLDHRGFWVKRGARAAFALESATGDVLELSNGGSENWVRVETETDSRHFRLGPWEKKRVRIAIEDGLTAFAVFSEGGFRPSELDPKNPDRRELGVFLRIPAFDVTP